MRAIDVIVAILCVLPFTGVLAARYLFGVFNDKTVRPRSFLLGFTAVCVAVGELEAILVVPLAFTYITGVATYNAEQTGLVLGVSLIAGIALPQVFALLVWFLRRE